MVGDTYEVVDNLRLAPLSWFTRTTFFYTPLMIELMIVAIVMRLLGLVQPFVFQAVIDRVLPLQREATLLLIVVVLGVTAILSAILDALAAYLGNHMGNRLTLDLAGRIFRHVLHLPLRQLQCWRVGETLTRISEIDTVKAFLTGTVSSILVDLLFAIIYVAALITISPMLTLIVLIVLPLQVIAFGVIGPLTRRRMQRAFLDYSRHQSRLVETLANVVTVKALGCEAVQSERLNRTLADSLLAGFEVTKLHIVNGFTGGLLGNVSVISIVFFGSHLVLRNEITLGQLIAFHLLADKVAGPILSLSAVWEQWQALRIARLRLGDLLNAAAETDISKPPLPVSGRLSLHLEAVSFCYLPEQPVILDLTLEISPDRPTVITGPSGCGKSTLAKLISGIYRPDCGVVEANGHKLTDYDERSVRQAIAYLPQEPELFSGSVQDNILLGNAAATDQEIRSALVESGCDLFIGELPNGILTDVGERGAYLSGGQRQRIALARALVSPSRALILDEPTSALDSASADIVIAAIKRHAVKSTVIIVTHNPELFGSDVNMVNIAQLQRPSDSSRQT
ncbi:peptidase domain-containing ABC transporter [Sinorhizobium meliloti]|uniref:peptidase domain-containing ABC transporter n=1 Tax=Rhizobium meliloti TaxID=382 RepID=UPI0013E2DF04|nr:peptidase domain-containing ABC transporter [Sinorhizobium meliloti]